MKKKYFLIIALIICGVSSAQSPEKMSYQAIVRNADGNLLANTAVGVQISILKTSSTGTSVYTELHTPTTNANGLITIEIGTGGVITGSFATINWDSDTYFIKTETDLNGGTNYTISGTSQLLSVPYALHAKTSGISYKIGDFAFGGVVFWVDETGKHGLVCAKDNQTAVAWFAGTFGNTYARGSGVYAGRSNNSIIISAQVAINKDDDNNHAARLCNELSIEENNITYGDWYLPSKFELNLMYQNKDIINTTSGANNGDAFINDVYWSSTENTISRAWIVNFNTGQETDVLKNVVNNVRAVRAF